METNETPHDVQNKTSNYNSGFVVTLMYGIGFTTYVLGLMSGLVVMFTFETNPLLMALVVWVFSFIFGTIFLGFGELIEVLTFIANNKGGQKHA